MKPLLVLTLSFLTSIACAQEPPKPAATPPAAPREDTFSRKVDLGDKLAEDFDWDAWFAKGGESTGERWESCYKAHQTMKTRMDELCAELRKKLADPDRGKALAAFNKMQKLWEEAAEAEIAFVGLEYEGGSEAKVSFAGHRFKVYLRRVKELKDLRNTAHFYE